MAGYGTHVGSLVTMCGPTSFIAPVFQGNKVVVWGGGVVVGSLLNLLFGRDMLG